RAVPVAELKVGNRKSPVDRRVEGYGDDHFRCTTPGAGYWRGLVGPTRRAVGSMPGLSCSSLATVVPFLAAIEPSVSPDWIVYLRTCPALWLCRCDFPFELTVVVGCCPWCFWPCWNPARTTSTPIVIAAR